MTIDYTALKTGDKCTVWINTKPIKVIKYNDAWARKEDGEWVSILTGDRVEI